MGISLTESRRRILLNTPHLATASGAIATFNTDMAAPLKECIVNIDPVQAGTGDPSPENIRSISGWSTVNAWRTGENLLGGEYFANRVKTSMPSAQINTRSKTVVFEAGAVASGGAIITKRQIPWKQKTRYTLLLTYSKNSYTYSNLRIYYTDGTSSNIANVSAAGSKQMTVTVSQANKTIAYVGKTNMGGITTLYYDECGVFEGVLTADDFEAYTGETVTVTIPDTPGTVYGGTLDLLKGVLTVRPYYASYNGETLVGPWISSMDVYAAGTTPTTGAQVVDLGDVADTYQLTPQQISTLKGSNNSWADCGPVDIKYWTHN